jgi:hypothetical protein
VRVVCLTIPMYQVVDVMLERRRDTHTLSARTQFWLPSLALARPDLALVRVRDACECDHACDDAQVWPARMLSHSASGHHVVIAARFGVRGQRQLSRQVRIGGDSGRHVVARLVSALVAAGATISRAW